jgi:putative cell wall-binding protein
MVCVTALLGSGVGSSVAGAEVRASSASGWDWDGAVVFGDRGETPRTVHLVDGSGARRRLSGDLDAIQPAWAPGGHQVAFASQEQVSARPGLYVVDVDGGAEQRLAEGPALYPAWSPDGSAVAFTGAGGRIWVVDADGTGLRAVSAPGADVHADLYPSWSPDASRLVFNRTVSSDTGADTDELWVAAAAGGDERQIGAGRDAAWSPDGRWIAFTDGRRVHVVRPDGTGSRPLSDGAFGPAWSPDGRSVAFGQDRALVVAGVDDGRVRTVVAGAAGEVTGVDWSADGRWIVYEGAGAWRVPAGGGTPERVSLAQTGRDPVAWPGIHRRAAGPSRIETAVAASRLSHLTADTVVIGSAEDYPDALAGAPLAARLDAPVLLNPTADLHPAVAAEIDRLDAARAVLLGGRAALSDDVAAQLIARGVTVERIAGAGRFDTAAGVADRLPDTVDAYLVEGAHTDPARGWPDAVAVSGVAAATGRPVLLTLHGELPEATRAAIERGGIERVVVVGGTAAVSDDVVRAVEALGVAVTRISGATRYDTSLAVAEHAAGIGVDTQQVWLATGRNWPDSLAAGAAAGNRNGMLLLIDGQDVGASPRTLGWLDRQQPLGAVLVGGPDVLHPDAAVRINATTPSR